MANWSSLPPDVLEHISINHLKSPVDYIRFRSVCSCWRSAAPRRSQPPWLIGHRHDDKHRLHTIYSSFSFSPPNLAPVSFLPELHLQLPARGCSHGWLALLDHAPGLTLFNPVTVSRIHLPKFTSFPECYDRKYWIDENGKFMHQSKNGKRIFQLSFKCMQTYLASKVILSSPPENPDCVVLAVRCKWKRLEFCRPGDSSWTLINFPDFRWFSVDAVFYNGSFYISCQRDIYVCKIEMGHAEVEKLRTTFVEPPTLHEDESYLVESVGDLLLVILFYADVVEWKLYKVEVFKVQCGKQVKLLKQRSIRDRALFLGRNHSFSVSAGSLEGIKGNCIYMAEYYKSDRSKIRVINLENGTNEFISVGPSCPDSNWEPCAWVMPSL